MMRELFLDYDAKWNDEISARNLIEIIYDIVIMISWHIDRLYTYLYGVYLKQIIGMGSIANLRQERLIFSCFKYLIAK